MEQYIPKLEDVQKAHKIYNEIIITMVLNPKKVTEAYRLLTGDKEALVNRRFAHKYVHAYFYNKKYLIIYPEYEETQKKTEENNKETEQDNKVQNEPVAPETESGMHQDSNNDANPKEELSIEEQNALEKLDSLFGLTEEEANDFDSEKEELLKEFSKLEKELNKNPKDRSAQVLSLIHI